MTKIFSRIFTLAALMSFGALATAQDSDLVGEWTLVTTGFSFVGTTTSYADLSIENEGGDLRAYIFSGPAPIRVDGDQFEVDLDWASGFDKRYTSTFRGSINDEGNMEGVMTHHGATNFLGRTLKDGTFTATRAAPPPELGGLPPDPVDMSGIYNRASGLGGVSKLTYSMTERGQSIMDDYLEMDNANSRCASPGLIISSGLPYPLEILHTDNYIVLLYGLDYARRIYLDGREFPEGATSSSFGFSEGEWKGQTLVVTTTKLNPTFLSTRGQPVSAEAYTTEHFFYDDKGYLHADMWVHDPKNFTRPPHLRRVYDQDFNPSVKTKIDCDPYTFFRALALEGGLEEFWNRAAQRR